MSGPSGVAELGSDHELVIAKIQLKLAAQGKKTKNPQLMDAELLLPQQARDYQINIANRFDASDQTCHPSQTWITNGTAFVTQSTLQHRRP